MSRLVGEDGPPENDRLQTCFQASIPREPLIGNEKCRKFQPSPLRKHSRAPPCQTGSGYFYNTAEQHVVSLYVQKIYVPETIWASDLLALSTEKFNSLRAPDSTEMLNKVGLKYSDVQH